MTSSNNPLNFTRFDSNIADEIHECFVGYRSCNHFVRIGPKGYFYPEYPDLIDQLASVQNVDVRKSDVFVVTFPRSGTTWTQELVWLIANDLDYATAKDKNLLERYNYLEYGSSVAKAPEQEESSKADNIVNMLSKGWGVDMLAKMPDPRFIKTHFPLSQLPPTILDTTKVVYVARDPRDVAVSYYHLNRLLPRIQYIGNFKTYWNLFIRDLLYRCPYFEHVKEAWEKRNNSNLLFIFYEELSENLPETIQRICDFLGKPKVTEEQMSKLCEHVKFENFKKNPSTNMEVFNEIKHYAAGEKSKFIRKGKCGGWRDYFDEEMTKQADAWIEENLRDTDLRFPQVNTKE